MSVFWYEDEIARLRAEVERLEAQQMRLYADARELYEYAEAALLDEQENPRADELRCRYATKAVTVAPRGKEGGK